MKTIDLTPLYRNSVGFDRMASLLDNALRTDSVSAGYPPYNIEVTGEDRYAVTIAVAGIAAEETGCVNQSNLENNNCTANDPSGSACTDVQFCTLTDACSAGSCVGTGSPCPGRR